MQTVLEQSQDLFQESRNFSNYGSPFVEGLIFVRWKWCARCCTLGQRTDTHETKIKHNMNSLYFLFGVYIHVIERNVAQKAVLCRVCVQVKLNNFSLPQKMPFHKVSSSESEKSLWDSCIIRAVQFVTGPGYTHKALEGQVLIIIQFVCDATFAKSIDYAFRVINAQELTMLTFWMFYRTTYCLLGALISPALLSLSDHSAPTRFQRFLAL